MPARLLVVGLDAVEAPLLERPTRLALLGPLPAPECDGRPVAALVGALEKGR